MKAARSCATKPDHTSSPVQNIGHLFHGEILASPSHVLRYGLRTIKGKTGGVKVDASAIELSSAEPATAATKDEYITHTASLAPSNANGAVKMVKGD